MYAEESRYDSGVDLAELLSRVEYDRDLLREVFNIFTEEFPRLKHLLRDSIAQADWKAVQSTAHTLKGMLASLSFRKASASALRIERMATHYASEANPAPEGMPEELARLERSAALAQQSLATVCREVIR